MLRDGSGNCAAGLDKREYWFSVLNGEVDDVVPEIVATYPAFDSIATGDLSSITMVFNEPVVRDIIRLAYVLYVQGGHLGRFHLQSTYFSFKDAVVTINLPTEYFQSFPGPVWIELPQDYVEDRAGNPFPGL